MEQSGLADPRLATYERNLPAVRDCGREPPVQIRKKLFSLKQFHGVYETAMLITSLVTDTQPLRKVYAGDGLGKSSGTDASPNNLGS
jgi:hypothetical protein